MASARVAKLLPHLALATATWCAAQQAQDQPLQFTIRQTSPNILQAEMHNAGNSPLTFSFGIRMAMDAVHLSITDAKAETTALTVKHYVTVDPTPASARRGLGRVTLQPGESRSFPIDLRYYKDEIGLPIAPGHYTLHATFTCDSAPVVPKVSYWTGSATAPPLPIAIPEDPIQ